MLLKEKLFDLIYKYKVPVCTGCGLIGHPNKLTCKSCKEELRTVNIPYACKLLFQELMAMNVAPRINIKELATSTTF